MRGLFITSVGTGVGKTLVTAILCHQLKSLGRQVRALKPVVSGFAPGDPSSDPALILRSLGERPSAELIAAITPWRFATPISPHLAARIERREMDIEDVATFCRERDSPGAGHLLIEGAGGVMTPLDETHTCLDLAARLGHPVVLVTGTYLGAISHTLTALAAMGGRGIDLAGIVVSKSEMCVGMDSTVETLRQFATPDIRLIPLPRLMGSDEQKWRDAPCLTGLCAAADD